MRPASTFFNIQLSNSRANEAFRKLEEESQSQMARLTGGMGGMF